MHIDFPNGLCRRKIVVSSELIPQPQFSLSSSLLDGILMKILLFAISTLLNKNRSVI